MGRRRFINILAYSVLFISALLSYGQAQASVNTISGTVSRPVADNNSLTVNLRICNQFDNSCSFRSLTIPAGQTSVPFSGEPTDFSSPAIIRYSCSSCDAPLVQRGYYAQGQPGNATALSENKTLINNAGGASGVNFTLASGSVISGTINFPSALQFSSGVDINLCTGEQPNQDCFYDFVQFEANDLSQSFALAVPPRDQDYELNFRCYSCGEDFFGTVYFAMGLPNSATASKDKATLISALQNTTGLNVTFQQGVTLSGSVTLPMSFGTAPSNIGADARICNSTKDICLSTNAQIDVGTTSAQFEFIVSSELSWILYANCYSCDQNLIFQRVFYSQGRPNNSFWSEAAATPISLSSNTGGFDVSLFPGTVFEGTVNAPDSGPSQFFYFDVFAFDSVTGFAATTNFPHFFGSSSTSENFSFGVPVVGDVIVGVIPSVNEPNRMSQSYLPYAFHSSGGGFTERVNATPVATDEGMKTGVDILLSVGNTISGSINLPEGESVSKNLFVHMIGDIRTGSGVNLNGFLDTEGYGGLGGYGGEFGSGGYLYGPPNAGRVNYFPVRISANSEPFRSFSFRISPNASTRWRTYYGCLNCGGEYERYGFFKNIPNVAAPSPLETFAMPAGATRVPGGSNYTDHDLFFVKQDSFCIPIVAANGNVVNACF